MVNKLVVIGCIFIPINRKILRISVPIARNLRWFRILTVNLAMTVYLFLANRDSVCTVLSASTFRGCKGLQVSRCKWNRKGFAIRWPTHFFQETVSLLWCQWCKWFSSRVGELPHCAVIVRYFLDEQFLGSLFWVWLADHSAMCSRYLLEIFQFYITECSWKCNRGHFEYVMTTDGTSIRHSKCH